MTVVEIPIQLKTLDKEHLMFSRFSQLIKITFIFQTSYLTVSVDRQGPGWNFESSRVHCSLGQEIRDAEAAGKRINWLQWSRILPRVQAEASHYILQCKLLCVETNPVFMYCTFNVFTFRTPSLFVCTWLVFICATQITTTIAQRMIWNNVRGSTAWSSLAQLCRNRRATFPR